jgi:hypothetical protein
MEKIFKIETILTCLKVLVIGVLLAILATVLINICNWCNCQISSEKLMTNWKLLRMLLVAFFSLLTLYVASSQLKKHADIAAITALTELRKLLTSEQNKTVHLALLPEEEQVSISVKSLNEGEKQDNKLVLPEAIPMTEIFNYLGTLELGVIMTEKELIDTDTFNSQFGYRIKNIFEEKGNFNERVCEHIKNNESYYQILSRGRDMVCKKR